MTVYINGERKFVNNLPSTNQVKDATLDTISFFYIDNNQNPLAPMTPVEVIEDGNFYYYVVIADSVERFTLTDNLYKHSVSCTERKRLLNKILVRNSVFTQPKDKYKTFSFNFSYSENSVVYEEDISNNHYSFATMEIVNGSSIAPLPKISLGVREKCKAVYLEARLQVAKAKQGEYRQGTFDATSLNDIHTLQELKDAFPDQFQGTPPLSYINPTLNYTLNGTHSEQISVPRFNEEFEAPRIAELIKEGATDIYLDYSGQPLEYATQYPNRGYHMPFYSIQLRARVEVYYYSAYDILKLLQERQIKTHSLDGSPFSLEEPFLIESNGDLYDLLSNTVAPNFTFTQNTMFECVSEVFRLFDATFHIDNNNLLSIDYFNDYAEDRTGQVEVTGANSALGEERYVNGLVSYYQDARTNEKFPMGEHTYAPSRASEIGIPAQGDHNFVTPHNIQSIVKAELKANVLIGGVTASSETVQYHLDNYPIDITSNIIEQSIWSGFLAVDGTFSVDDIKQNNTVYFAQGDNKIQLAYSYKDEWGTTYYSFGNMIVACYMKQLGLTAQYVAQCLNVISPSSSAVDWGNVFMRVEYLTTIDGKVRVESAKNKFEGELIIDQSSGGVDLNKLGLNILGLSYRMGEPALGISYKATSWDNRIKPGQTILYGGEVWVANSCQYTSLGNGYHQGKISFVKNYNELALRKTLLREKRMSNIAQNLVLKSEETIMEYCYFSSTSIPESQVSCFSRTTLGYALVNSFGGSTIIKTLDHSVLKSGTKYIYLPTIRYGAGNCVCFEMNYDSPISAGISTDPNNRTEWFGTQGFYSYYVPYADENGFLDECSIGILFNTSISFDHYFPQVTYSNNVACSITNLKLKKQPNEIFALNYEIAFLAEDEQQDFVGSAFIDDNFLVNGYMKKKELRLYYSNEPYSVLDTEGKGNYIPIALSSSSVSFDYTELVFGHSELDTDYWAICDNQGKILFASNSHQPSTEKRLYFALRRERL